MCVGLCETGQLCDLAMQRCVQVGGAWWLGQGATYVGATYAEMGMYAKRDGTVWTVRYGLDVFSCLFRTSNHLDGL